MSARAPRWDDLQIFLVTARERTLASAAKELDVNASTIHRRIGALEKQLGLSLFHRSHSGYRLTGAGQELLNRAQRIEESVLSLSRAMNGRDAALRGVVRISTVDDLADVVVTPLLQPFLVEHPEIRLELILADDAADLSRGDADLSLRLGRRPEEADVVARQLSSCAIAFYASKSYLSSHGRPGSPSELAAHSIVRGDLRKQQQPIERFTDLHVPTTAASYRSTSMLNRLAAVKAGFGIGALPCFSADKVTSLERLWPPDPAFSVMLWLVRHVDLKNNARVRLVAEYLTRELRLLRPTFAGMTK